MFNTRTKLFFFAYLKYTTGAALKNAAPAQTKKYLLRLRSRPKSGGSGSATLGHTCWDTQRAYLRQRIRYLIEINFK